MSSMALAQSSRDPKKKEVRVEPDRSATYGTKKSKTRKKIDKSYTRSFDKKIEEYHARMKANAKEDVKMAREMQKPQYSDPAYFGHKKKPKKRPPGKKKFCKECGMWH
jgi:hypothetical protein